MHSHYHVKKCFNIQFSVHLKSYFFPVGPLVPCWDTLRGRDPPLGHHWCESRRKEGQDAKHILGSVRVEGAGMCTIVSSV